MYYVYIHYRASDLTPFYVGKGSGDRAYCFNQRSEYWTRTFKKHGVITKLVNEYEQEKDAFLFERYLIKKFKDSGFQLVNLTDGGEGVSGFKQSKETVEKRSIRMLGNTNWKNAPKPPRLLGKLNPSFKGFVEATCIATGETIILDGKLSAESNGFDYKKVNACVNNTRKTHKGFTFKRMKELNNGKFNNYVI